MYDFWDFKVAKVDYHGVTYDTGMERIFKGATKSVSSEAPSQAALLAPYCQHGVA